jgi:Tol biopolymer transport system component
LTGASADVLLAIMSQWSRRRPVSRLLLATACGLLVPALVAAQSSTARVSMGPGGVQGNAESYDPALSAEGRWVAFASRATNLVNGDTNALEDVFTHNHQTGTTRLVSVSSGGTQGNAASNSPAISANGRYVAFRSSASNLVGSDTNQAFDVFVHDQANGTTTRVSVATGGAQGNDQSGAPSISASGQWIAFASAASNLVPNDTNNQQDVFVYDQLTRTTTRVSVGAGGAQGNDVSWQPAISADGRWVAFASQANNLVAGDTNLAFDVFVHDRQTRTTTRASVATAGAQANDVSRDPTISADGRLVAFASVANNLVPGDTNVREDVFVHDRETGATTRVSVGTGGTQANAESYAPAISADGRSVAFTSVASNLVPGDANGRFDVFVHEWQTATTTRVSVSAAGTEGNAESWVPAISVDGRFVAFESLASNLVANDTNLWDVFVHDRGDAGCSVSLAPAVADVSPLGAQGSVLVLAAAGCPWTATSHDPSWLSITGATSGTGIGALTYAVPANPGSPRSGTLTIGGETFTVNQTSGEAFAPLPPVGLVVSSIVGNTVTLRWTVPATGPSPTQFVLEGGLNPGEVLATLPSDTAAPSFTFVAPSGSFYVRMHALNGPFRSAASNEILIHVNVPIAPSPPSHLLGLVDGSALTLAWTNSYAGGAPTSLILDVTGSLVTSLPLGVANTFSFAGVPAGTYTLSLRAQNAAGASLPSNALTLTFPGPCSGAPQAPTDFTVSRVGSALFVNWAPGTSGPAPTGYVLQVSGAFVGSFPTGDRALSGVVGPGSYTLSVMAVNSCGASPLTTPLTVVVP